ncbi:MAG: tRNA glutamyl-Q(34) synthetase GluQRS [Thiomicrospira sp.]
MPTRGYIGRFAPTPSGALHFGSLIAACASYLDAKAHHGRWLVRIDDIDTPRVQPASITHILHTLESFGFEWEGDIRYQSEHLHTYQHALDTLIDEQHAYACDCSRKAIFNRQANGIYDGHCRLRALTPRADCAIRFNIAPYSTGPYLFHDAIQPQHQFDLTTLLGDFILRRRDGLFGYQLACAIDDAEQSITHVVRGSDLLNSALAQTLVLQALKRPTPHYAHHPIALSAEGIKLSKSANSPALATHQATHLLWQALDFLGQQPPNALQHASLSELWPWAITHWQRDAIARQQQRTTTP